MDLRNQAFLRLAHFIIQKSACIENQLTENKIFCKKQQQPNMLVEIRENEEPMNNEAKSDEMDNYKERHFLNYMKENSVVAIINLYTAGYIHTPFTCLHLHV